MNINISVDDFLKSIGNLDYGVALHSITEGNILEKKKIAESILKQGLNFTNSWRTILSTTVSLGTDSNNMSEFNTYRLGNDVKCNVVVLSPIFLKNSKGETIYLGFPKKNLGTASQQYNRTCVLDQICSRLGRIPSELIYGYFDDSLEIAKNSNYLLNSDESMKLDEMFEIFKGAMDDFSRFISDCVVNKKIDELKRVKASFDEKGFRDEMLESAIEEVEKNVIRSNVVDEHDNMSFNDNMFKFIAEIPLIRGMSGFSIDEKKFNEKLNDIKLFLDSFSLSDLANIDNSNISLCTYFQKVINLFPKEFTIDKLLENVIKDDLKNISSRRRIILLDSNISDKEKMMEKFNKCLSSYLLMGGTNVYDRFKDLISEMNKKGYHVNVGNSIIKCGDFLVQNMESLQSNNERNSYAWKLLLNQVLHFYSVLEMIDSRKYNPKEFLVFEERLIQLGIIDRKLTNHENNEYLIFTSSNNNDNKSDNKNMVASNEKVLDDVINQYINTGMIANGFEINELGEVVTISLEKQNARAAAIKAYEEQKRREIQLSKLENEKVRVTK